MRILGCITAVNPTSLDVALPGRIDGTVQVAMISQSYVNMAKQYLEDAIDESEYNALSDLYRVGQIVCAKVMKIESTKKVNIDLSLQPKDIQSDFKHNGVKKNMILSVAIAERQEHGYVIETGIHNLRGFLPLKNAETGSIGVGGVYFCRVEKITVTSTASTATFALTTNTSSRLLRFTEPNADHILPGCVAQFTIKKILKDGLQGEIFAGSMSACINEFQLGFTENGGQRQLKDFKVNSILEARILYVMPLTKIAYLSFNLQDQYNVTGETIDSKHQTIYPVGTIIEKAVVSFIRSGNIVLKFTNARGVISMRSIKTDIKTNFDSEVVLSNYQKDSVHKARVIYYDPIDALHVCSVDKKILNEKYFSLKDVSTGDMVTVKMLAKLKDGRHVIRLGKIRGFIHPLYLSKNTAAKKLEPNSLLRCRIVCKHLEKGQIYCTNIKEYMENDKDIITANATLSIDSKHLGMVKSILEDGWVIEFFDYMSGMIYRKQLPPNELNTAQHFYEGQIVNVSIKSIRYDGTTKRISLGLADYLTDIGSVHRGKITAIQPTGLDVAFLSANINGFVPIMYVSDYPSLVHGLFSAYRCNEDVEAVGVTQNCYSIRDVTDNFGSRINLKAFSELNAGDIVPAFIKNVSGDMVQVYCMLKDIKTTFSIHLKMFVENYDRASDITLVPDQKIFVKILSKNSTSKSLALSAKLSDVWLCDLLQTASIMKKYFADVNEIAKRSHENTAFNNLKVGQIVEGVPVERENRAERVFLVNDSVEVILTERHGSRGNDGSSQKILIVWKDYAKKLVYGTTTEKLLSRAETKCEEDQATEQLLSHPGFKANVLLVLDDLIIVYPTKWTNRFVYIPTRFHHNDFQPIIPKGIHQGSQINIALIGVKGTYYIGMIHSLYELYKNSPDLIQQMIRIDDSVDDQLNAEEIEVKDESDDDDANEEDIPAMEKSKVTVQSKKNAKSKGIKRKAHEKEAIPNQTNEEYVVVDISPAPKKKKKAKQQKKPSKKQSPKGTGAIELKKKIKKKSAKASEAKKKKFSLCSIQLDGAMDLGEIDSDSDSETSEEILPGVSNFWSADLSTLNGAAADNANSDSSDDENEIDANGDGKRKANAKERFEAARNEEARIHEIERTLADGDFIPTSIDQFERLVMGDPNDSRIWIQYMAFHIQATEMDRARTIAQKALKVIDMREGQERLNIWVALLNTELRYGNKTTFDDTLKEALLLNEPFKIYAICLKMFANCNRIQELNDLVLTITKKFRQMPDSWLFAAQSLFEVNLAEKAKSLLNKSLASLHEKDRKYIPFFIIFFLFLPKELLFIGNIFVIVHRYWSYQ